MDPIQAPLASPASWAVTPPKPLERPVQRVLIRGVRLNLPRPNDLFFYRVVNDHIHPFLLYLNYANRRGILVDKPIHERQTMAMAHLRQNLPQRYTRWVTIDEHTRAVVLATNRIRSDLALAFNLDMLEKIRRLMGVPWIPTWNIPESEMHTPFKIPRPDILPELVDWPHGMPSLPSLTWKGLNQLEEPDWTDLWNMVDVRLEMRVRVKGGELPDEDVPMSQTFRLDEPLCA
ncbi:hypothetical protein BKA70DRAFT_1290793 [Coprinopsis sp. MPI-PUGE-AT-0042]|nr:hypothetical protein BKA70DRAFT_1290793 [Coprinopsis sp. MPI-PUGE-AT-0042]